MRNLRKRPNSTGSRVPKPNLIDYHHIYPMRRQERMKVLVLSVATIVCTFAPIASIRVCMGAQSNIECKCKAGISKANSQGDYAVTFGTSPLRICSSTNCKDEYIFEKVRNATYLSKVLRGPIPLYVVDIGARKEPFENVEEENIYDEDNHIYRTSKRTQRVCSADEQGVVSDESDIHQDCKTDLVILRQRSNCSAFMAKS